MDEPKIKGYYADYIVMDDYLPPELTMLKLFLWATGFEACYCKSGFKTHKETLCQQLQELRKAVAEFKKEMRKTCLYRFVLMLLELKVHIDIYLTNEINRIICIVRGHDPVWYNVGTFSSYKYCRRCRKRWYRYGN